MAKTQNRCWYCGKRGMTDAPELGRGWLKCPKCGTTYIQPPKTTPHYDLVIKEGNPAAGESKYRPSAGLTQAVSKTRQARERVVSDSPS